MSKRKAPAQTGSSTPGKKPRNVVSDAWATVDAFRKITEPSSADIVRLEWCMVQILEHQDVERHCLADGLSQQFHRYRTDNGDMAPKKELKHLRRHYWSRSRQLETLKRTMDKKESAIQKTCDHVWERDLDDRDHRSHYDCNKCGAYR
jgi:hypothetical protein|tara:strand:+ start:9654 stop:10097 length:444 start_codon:yes stop_codon:yes gene_type:complete